MIKDIKENGKIEMFCSVIQFGSIRSCKARTTASINSNLLIWI